MDAFTDLESLQAHVSAKVQASSGEAMAANGLTCSTDDEAQKKQASDLATSLAVKFLAENHPPASPKGRRQLRKYVRTNVRRIRNQEAETHAVAPDKCGFFFLLLILESILSWIVWKVCDEVWADYKKSHNSPQVYADMAQDKAVCSLAPITRMISLDDDEPDGDSPDD